ncbi:hypothetical protein PQU92_10860 [Asticcacaulis sp. BYS171W]|uniref:Uncharacterized protein n=1 Tax=Asticcacaulis aquaticus TaxID=2984212 RepID=A0ABT5HUR0_9CAUL|nr:hypothetical protein [Asticcacaulis aquaticus]MDC7683779.1 hypothetical protein [Asticcacaulis aquaticus]
MIPWPKSPAYVALSITLWVIFLAAIFGLTWGKAYDWPAPALWALALVPALTVLTQTKLAYDLISKQDEFVRAVIARQMLIAIGLTITVVVAFSPFQQFLGAPDVPAWLVYPLFWAVFGMITPFVKGSI